ncbi:MAG: hypothetical protein LBL65_05350 [Campylobacteraceae bacterium]|jgi:hypothetical protein|nr:hypothetical protein [Campylobacteraceae bacterium]
MSRLQIVSFKQAKKLQKLGFGWKTQYVYRQYYNEKEKLVVDLDYYYIADTIELKAPEVALALKWFRDVKNIRYDIDYYKYIETHYYYFYINGKEGNIRCKTYEEAESCLLDKLIKEEEK